MDDHEMLGKLELGQEIVVTGWIGLEGSSILAREREELLLSYLPQKILQKVQYIYAHIDIERVRQITSDLGATSIYIAGKGGIYGALWEMAKVSEVGIQIDLKSIPIRQETIEICEVFDIDPYMLMSGGALLVGTHHGASLVETLRRMDIHSHVVGHVTGDNDRVILHGEERRYLEPPKKDALYRALDMKMEDIQYAGEDLK